MPTLGSTLAIEFAGPESGQTVTSGNLTVNGLAVETGGTVDDPFIVQRVTVQLNNATPIDAQLGPPPHPERGARSFSASIHTGESGQFRITATAINDRGRSVSKSRDVILAGGAVLPIFPGTSTPWTNYVGTQNITPAFFGIARSLDDLIAIVRQAESQGRKVHATGSGWSYSDCAITPDYMVETDALQKPIQTVQLALIGTTPPTVYHVEAGIKIRHLYENLDSLGLALETMGGASGQSLAGAISTGTHGGDYLIAPLADSVLAIHLVGAGGTQYWIEPTNAITDPQLLRQHVIPNIDSNNIIYDDLMFDSCLVSLGCMGIIYAIVLRVRPQYDLIDTTIASTWNDFVSTANARLSDTSNRFLQVAIDPYLDSSNNNKCMITTRTEAAPTTTATRPGPGPFAIPTVLLDAARAASPTNWEVWLAHGLSDILSQSVSDRQMAANIVGFVLSETPGVWSSLAASYWDVMQLQLPVGTFRGKSFSVMDTTYGSPPEPSIPSYSIELFFPVNSGGKLGFVDFVNAALQTINAATATFLVGYVSLRFTGGTRAILGMQQWNQTCAVEISVLSGVQGEQQLLIDILNLVYQFGGLPHWGQLIDYGGVQGNATLYPRIGQWRDAYARLSSNFTARTFENSLSARWQLTVSEELQLAGITNDGSIWHTIRGLDGSWVAFGDVKGQAGNVGTFDQIAIAAVAGEMQLAGVTTDGNIWHTIRRADGSWQGLGDIKGPAGNPGAFKSVAVAGAAELQLAGVTTDGNIWHTIRHADGSWQVFGNIKGPAGDVGSFTAVGTADVAGELQVIGVTADGNIWHTIRHADGSWQVFGNIKGPAGDVGSFTAVGTADVAGELQVIGVTTDGNMWHTIRHANGSWDPFGNVKEQSGDVGSFTAVGTADVTGELQVVGVTGDGNVWHTIRYRRPLKRMGRLDPLLWQPFGNVKGVAGNPEAFTAVAIAATVSS